MASLAASTAATSLGMSEMLGNPLNFSGTTRSVPSRSSPATFKTVALFGRKKAAAPPPKQRPAAVVPANDELAKWYGKSVVFNLFASFLHFSLNEEFESPKLELIINGYLLVVAGPDRRIFLPEGLLDRSEIPEYLTGEVPGEYVSFISNPH